MRFLGQGFQKLEPGKIEQERQTHRRDRMQYNAAFMGCKRCLSKLTQELWAVEEELNTRVELWV